MNSPNSPAALRWNKVSKAIPQATYQARRRNQRQGRVRLFQPFRLEGNPVDLPSSNRFDQSPVNPARRWRTRPARLGLSTGQRMENPSRTRSSDCRMHLERGVGAWIADPRQSGTWRHRYEVRPLKHFGTTLQPCEDRLYSYNGDIFRVWCGSPLKSGPGDTVCASDVRTQVSPEDRRPATFEEAAGPRRRLRERRHFKLDSWRMGEQRLHPVGPSEPLGPRPKISRVTLMLQEPRGRNRASIAAWSMKCFAESPITGVRPFTVPPRQRACARRYQSPKW